MTKITGITGASGVTSILAEVDLVTHSKEVQYKAQPRLIFEQLAEKRTELDKQPGKTIRFPKVNDIEEGDELTENTDIVVDDFSMGHVDITVKQYGKGLALTEWLLAMAAYNVWEFIDNRMAVNYALTSNLMFVQKIFQTTPTVLYGHDKAGRSTLTPSDVMTTDIFKNVTENFDTRNVPERMDAIAGGSARFVAAVHPHMLRQIKNDKNWETAQNYAGSTNLFSGEFGMYDNIRVIRTTAVPIIKHPGTYTPYAGGGAVTPASNVGHVFINGKNMTDHKPAMFPAQTIVPGQIIYQTAFFGDRGLALAEAMPVELRHNGILDFERRREIAWVRYAGCGLLNDDRIIVVETLGTR